MIGLRVASFGIGAKEKERQNSFPIQIQAKKESAMKKYASLFFLVLLALVFSTTGATVAQAGSIFGEVLDAKTGGPLLKPAQVFLCTMEVDEWGSYLNCDGENNVRDVGNETTSAYSFDGLPANTYYVMVYAEGGYPDTFYPNASQQEDATPIVLGQSDNFQADMDIAPYAFLFYRLNAYVVGGGTSVSENGGKVVVSGILRNNTARKGKVQTWYYTSTVMKVSESQWVSGDSLGTTRTLSFVGPTKKRPITFEDKAFSFTITVPKGANNGSHGVFLTAGQPMAPVVGTEWIGRITKGTPSPDELSVSTTRRPVGFHLDGTPIWKKPGR